MIRRLHGGGRRQDSEGLHNRHTLTAVRQGSISLTVAKTHHPFPCAKFEGVSFETSYFSTGQILLPLCSRCVLLS